MTKSEISKILEHGAELWMILKKINNTACNRSEQESSRLREDFEQAHDFFVHKMESHQNDLNLKKVL